MRVSRVNVGLRAKRLMDIVGAGVGCAVLVIPGALIALLIRRESNGSPIYTQERVGQGGTSFELLKFRSMLRLEDSFDASGNPLDNYDRVTRLGAILRRTSLDETPQLLNVLKGEMSLVGPRPTLQYQVDRYTPSQRRRLEMKPGLTGLAQVSGRNSLTWEQKIELDLKYVDEWSLRVDIRIILRTFAVIVARESTDFTAHDSLSSHAADYREDI